MGELPWPSFGPIQEKIEECYLPKKEEPVSTTEVPSIPETKEATHEELLRMVIENPNLRKLVETFELTTAHSSENENFTIWTPSADGELGSFRIDY